jgi:molybdopterin synthase catalytic subunit
MKIEIRPEPFEPWGEIAQYQKMSNGLVAGSYGACAAFVGTMRDFNEGDHVQSMLLEHYPAMTENHLTKLVTTAITDHGLLDVLLLHRVGEIFPDDPIVLVSAWSAHRAAAYTACREIMEMLKSKATFWKKEQLRKGARWVVSNTPG